MGSENHTDATFTGLDISHQMPRMFHPVETVLVPPLFPDLLYRHVLGALDKDSPHGELAVALRRHADDLRSLARESRYVLMGVRRDVDGLRDGDVPAAVEFGRVAAAPVNTLRQQPHRCQEISVCF